MVTKVNRTSKGAGKEKSRVQRGREREAGMCTMVWGPACVEVERVERKVYKQPGPRRLGECGDVQTGEQSTRERYGRE